MLTDGDTGKVVPIKKVDPNEVAEAEQDLEIAQEELDKCREDGNADCSKEEKTKVEAEVDVRVAKGQEVAASTTDDLPADPDDSKNPHLVPIIVGIAAVIIIIVIVVVVLQTRVTGSPAQAVQSFENPMYDSAQGYNEPAYMDAGGAMGAPSGGAGGASGYMDVQANTGGNAGGTTGYMDIKPSAPGIESTYDNMAGSSGYMDVAPEANINDDSDEEV